MFRLRSILYTIKIIAKMLADLFLKFEQALTENNSPILDRMQEGLKPEIVNTMLSENEVNNETLVDLYTWKNGNLPDLKENVIEKLELFPEGIMLSIQDALYVYKLYTRVELSWKAGLFPIFSNGGGNYLLLDILSSSETQGMILLYDPVPMASENIVTIYDSANALFTLIVECIAKGAYKYELDGKIDIDFYLRNEICSMLNPHSAYWKDV